MVFGVFDRLHPGHLSFLHQAKRYGQELIVILARDSAAQKLKLRKPLENEKKRLAALQKTGIVDRVFLGDKKQSSYGVIKKYKPDIICLGYDQKRLKNDLEKKLSKKALSSIKLIRLTPHRPQKFHSSRLQ